MTTPLLLASLPSELLYLQKLLRHPQIKVGENEELPGGVQLIPHIRSKLGRLQNPSREEDLAYLEQAIERGKNPDTVAPAEVKSLSPIEKSEPSPITETQTETTNVADQGRLQRIFGSSLAVFTALTYTTAAIGIPLGFVYKPKETYEAFEKLHLDSAQAQVLAGVLGGFLLIALLACSYSLIKNNPAPPSDSLSNRPA